VGTASSAVNFSTSITTTDNNVNGNVQVVCSRGTSFADTFQATTNPNVVNCTATDSANLSTVCSFVVTVNDIEAPSINCSNVTTATVSGGNYGEVNVSDLISGTDLISSAGEMSYSCSSGNSSFNNSRNFTIGSYGVTCSGMDGAGNEATCSVQVVIEGRVVLASG